MHTYVHDPYAGPFVFVHWLVILLVIANASVVVFDGLVRVPSLVLRFRVLESNTMA